MSQSTISNKRLKGKDLINVGVFTAMYFVIVFAVALLGYIPIFMPLLCVLVPIVGGIPFMLFLTKVKKFGMIWIMSVIMGILMLLTGMGFYSILVGAVSGLIARQGYGQEYIDALTRLMPPWMCPVLLIAAFLSGLIGGLLGKAALKKHFQKAGIA